MKNIFICILLTFAFGILQCQNLPKLIVPLGHTNTITSVNFSSDNKFLISTSLDRTTKLWDIATGKLLFSIDGDFWVNQGQFINNGGTIIITTEDNKSHVWDVNKRQLLFSIEGITKGISKSFSDGTVLIATSDKDTAKIWNATNGILVFKLTGHSNKISDICFSNDNKTFITASLDGTLKIWNAFSGIELNTLEGPKVMVKSVEFSPNDKKILSFLWDNTIVVYDAITSEILYSIKDNQWDNIINPQFSPDGSVVISCLDTIIKIWDSNDGRFLQSCMGHKEMINSIEFSPDSKTIISASNDHTSKIWDVKTGNLLFSLEGKEDNSFALFSPDGQTVVTVENSIIKIWNTQTGKLIHILDNKSNNRWHYSRNHPIIPYIEFNRYNYLSSQDETSIYYALIGKVQIYDSSSFWAMNGKFNKEIILQHESCLGVNFDLNLIISCYNNIVSCWDIETEKKLCSWISFDSTDYVLFHPDGYYDGTPKALNYLYFTCGTEIIDNKQLLDQLYVPGLLDKIINRENINKPKLSNLEICPH